MACGPMTGKLAGKLQEKKGITLAAATEVESYPVRPQRPTALAPV